MDINCNMALSAGSYCSEALRQESEAKENQIHVKCFFLYGVDLRQTLKGQGEKNRRAAYPEGIEAIGVPLRSKNHPEGVCVSVGV